MRHVRRQALACAVLSSLLSSCGGGGGAGSAVPMLQYHTGSSSTPTSAPATPPPASPKPVSGASSAPTTNSALPFSSYVNAQGQWLAQHQLADGAIEYASTEIEPYFANIAATGWLKVPSQLAAVRAWMAWYVAHINASDVWNLGGTMYDYSVSASGVETSLQTADSVDSYAATFLTLARQLYDTRDATSQAYVVSLQATLERLGATIMAIQEPDGMTVATPSYLVAYLEDNCEVHRGFIDLAYLEQAAFSNPLKGAAYTAAAAKVAAGVATLWNASSQIYAYAKDEPNGGLSASSWATWYPGATSQLFPVLEGVIPATSTQAIALWNAFNAAYPTWDQLTGEGSSAGGFPWALVGDTAAMMGDGTHADAYVQSVQKLYGANGYASPWYDAESGWYARMNDQLLLGYSLSPAEN
jgi:hypothetical protein